ncbi:MAG: type II and III secretion system protein family protein [Alphaproteobacteria bacterium]|nr:type II and III secretion system protein family protein [Alphaproteobacteria bacterium]
MKNNNKKQNNFWALMLCFLCMGAFMLGSMELAKADKSDVALLKPQKTPGVTLMLGKAEMVNIEGEIADVLVADPSVVDVMAVKSNRLYLVGSSLGDTNIMALDSEGNVLKKVNVHVQMDTEKLQEMIGELYPNEPVEIRAMTDQVVLTGDVSTPAVANKIVNLVGRYAADAQGINGTNVDNIILNMMGVRGEQQVMLKVKIVEASRSALKDLGLELNSLGGANIGNLGGTLATSPALGLSAPAQLGVAALNYSSGGFGNLNFVARALEQEGIINTLAEPNLTAISGEQAGFLAGGEFPIPTQIDRNGNLIYEFRPFGVSLNFRPVVMSSDRISLQLTTEVSTTSFDQNLQLNGINVPTFNVRRAETNVELPSGGTLMIAGLIKSDAISGLTQLPGIGDVPVVGDLIKSDTFRRSESEVVVMITPYLVQPFAQNKTVAAAQPMPVDTQPAYTQVGPDKNYGAMTPNDENLPSSFPDMNENAALPAREDSAMPEVFSKNIKRVYGEKTYNNLNMDKANVGYLLD